MKIHSIISYPHPYLSQHWIFVVEKTHITVYNIMQCFFKNSSSIAVTLSVLWRRSQGCVNAPAPGMDQVKPAGMQAADRDVGGNVQTVHSVVIVSRSSSWQIQL